MTIGNITFGPLVSVTPKPKSVIKGVRIVWGVPDKLKPLVGAPKGKVRFRFRNTAAGKVFIRNERGVHHFILLDNGQDWGVLPQGSNIVGQSNTPNPFK